jgi:hypothetical protein
MSSSPRTTCYAKTTISRRSDGRMVCLPGGGAATNNGFDISWISLAPDRMLSLGRHRIPSVRSFLRATWLAARLVHRKSPMFARKEIKRDHRSLGARCLIINYYSSAFGHLAGPRRNGGGYRQRRDYIGVLCASSHLNVLRHLLCLHPFTRVTPGRMAVLQTIDLIYD